MNFVLYVMRVPAYRNYTLLLRITTPLSRLFHGNYNFDVDDLARRSLRDLNSPGASTFSIVDFLFTKIPNFPSAFI